MERIATSYGVLLQGIEEQNFSPKMVIFWSFRAQTPSKWKGELVEEEDVGGAELPL